ncbi:MAG TPA: hypothetical protein VNM39_17985 [Verrucomicrobiae bacterium]|nr:hypothetical protein [Verrucomicrobiae bacterium]
MGAKRALAAIAKNEQTRRMYVRLQPLGLSPEQRERVVLILGAHALRRPVQESPTLQALRASGRTGRLSDEEVQHIRDEQQQIADRALRSFRPALASVLTPAQLAQAGLGAEGPSL